MMDHTVVHAMHVTDATVDAARKSFALSYPTVLIVLSVLFLLLRDAMLTRCMLSSCVSVCLSHSGIVPKRLTEGSCK